MKATESNPSPKVRVLVVDDHPLMRDALARLIDRQKDLTCCAEADSGASAQAAILGDKPGLVVLDLRLRHEDGLELIKTLNAQFPDLPILVLSRCDEMVYAERALRAGARGYLMKDEAPEEVLRAIRVIVNGERYVSRRVALRLFEQSLDMRPQPPGGSALELLTDRELQVFELLGAKLSTREIAAKLKLSFKTIEAHRENIKHKLYLRSGEELLQAAENWVQNCQPPTIGPRSPKTPGKT